MQIQMGMHILASKEIDKEEFERIMEEHTLWLKDNKQGKRADLSELDLSKMDLSGKDLSYADMRHANLTETKLVGANLSNVDFTDASLHNADLTKAIVEGTDFTKATLTMATMDECKGEGARFLFARLWDANIKNAVLKDAFFLDAQVCDCDFAGSDLEDAVFDYVDLDNTVFTDTNLRNASFCYARRTYWCDFKNADMTGTRTDNIDLDPERLEGVKGLYRPMFCPEEGSFIAWKKCREGKIVKLLIPETAERKGYSLHSCRASEAVVLDVFDREGNPVDEAISLVDPDFKYAKGQTVVAKEAAARYYGDATGIHFVLTRAETDYFADSDKKKKNQILTNPKPAV